MLSASRPDQERSPHPAIARLGAKQRTAAPRCQGYRCEPQARHSSRSSGGRSRSGSASAPRYWRGTLWSATYFAASTAGATLAVIRQYVEQ
ncbi:MAG: transposase [Bradyrhizobium sp.]|nr:transposase [Bradyrhizobium sp.]